jgi:hypothetical protein
MQRDRAGVGPMGGRYGHHSALSPGFPRTALRDSLARMQKSHGTRIECCVSSFAQVWRPRWLTLALPGEQAWSVQNRWFVYGKLGKICQIARAVSELGSGRGCTAEHQRAI